jgi:hypothetical protein
MIPIQTFGLLPYIIGTGITVPAIDMPLNTFEPEHRCCMHEPITTEILIKDEGETHVKGSCAIGSIPHQTFPSLCKLLNTVINP